FVAVLIGPWIAVPFGACVAGMLHLVHAIVEHFSRATADVRVPAPANVVLLVACGLLVFAVFAVRRRRWLLWGCVAVCAVPLLTLWPQRPLLHAGVLEVTAIDVGQGDSLLVVAPDGKTMLVDAGGPVGQMLTPDRWDVGEEVVAPYLWSRKIARLDTVVLSHAHSDHMGGMGAVLRDMRPRELWVSVEPGESPDMRALLAEAATLGIRVRWMRAGDKVSWGGMQGEVLSPERGYANDAGATNDDSLVLSLRFDKASVLLEGDAEAPSEAAMVHDGLLRPVTLLKVGHHGSMTSTNPEFLAAVQPRDAVISVGRRNTFGHPRFEVLERLEKAGAKVFRTDTMGAETFLLRSDGSIVAKSAASN
ncbi:MAG: ComEC/Rec2 family competence protein, partial [Bryocella sp.]